ncbi:MAG TPA: ABC transporter permease subunit, partial [Acidovorax sp.]|nr:ABC transporter permease subunit [Acidovorax sp.]
MLLALWPQGWSRQQRSNATLVAALVVMVLALSLLGHLLSFFPDPIGPNAQAFSEGARTTLWLTLVSGAVGLVLGTAAALARTARWTPVRWVAGVYIWAIRGTPLLVQILFVYFALPVLVPGLNLPDFAAA